MTYKQQTWTIAIILALIVCTIAMSIRSNRVSTQLTSKDKPKYVDGIKKSVKVEQYTYKSQRDTNLYNVLTVVHVNIGNSTLSEESTDLKTLIDSSSLEEIKVNEWNQAITVKEELEAIINKK